MRVGHEGMRMNDGGMGVRIERWIGGVGWRWRVSEMPIRG